MRYMVRSKMFVYVKPAAPVAAGEAAAKKEKLTLPDIILADQEIVQPAARKSGKGKKASPVIVADETAEMKPKQPPVPEPTDEPVPDSTPQMQTKLEGEEPVLQEAQTQIEVVSSEKTERAGEQIAEGPASKAQQTITPADSSPMQSSSLEPLRVLEAALFMSSQSMHAAELGKLVGIGAVGHVNTLLSQLSKQYEQSGSSLEVVEENAGKWVMRIRASFAPSVRRFAGEAEIPKHALRTLAYISRHEGITKRDLFRRLGGSIYEDVADLADKGFLQTKPLGRTHSLSTTTKFKQYFQG